MIDGFCQEITEGGAKGAREDECDPKEQGLVDFGHVVKQEHDGDDARGDGGTCEVAEL